MDFVKNGNVYTAEAGDLKFTIELDAKLDRYTVLVRDTKQKVQYCPVTPFYYLKKGADSAFGWCRAQAGESKEESTTGEQVLVKRNWLDDGKRGQWTLVEGVEVAIRLDRKLDRYVLWIDGHTVRACEAGEQEGKFYHLRNAKAQAEIEVRNHLQAINAPCA